ALASGPAGASVTDATASTNPSGVATFTGLTITGPVGSYTLAFTSGTLTGVTSSTVTLSAGPAARLVKQAGDSQSATVGTHVLTAPAVLVTDQSGNPVAGVGVTFGVTAGGGGAGRNDFHAATGRAAARCQRESEGPSQRHGERGNRRGPRRRHGQRGDGDDECERAGELHGAGDRRAGGELHAELWQWDPHRRHVGYGRPERRGGRAADAHDPTLGHGAERGGVRPAARRAAAGWQRQPGEPERRGGDGDG